MKISKIKIFIAIMVLVLAGGTIYYFKSKPAIENQSLDSFGKLEVYKNSQYGFSFSYPDGFNVSDFDDSGGKMILVKNAASDSTTVVEANGFQVFITAFDEPGPITKARILKDIPDLVITNDKIISLGGESALSFKSKDESGETLEIWFVHPIRSQTSNGASDGYLYRIKAYESFQKQMMEILGTWKFQ